MVFPFLLLFRQPHHTLFLRVEDVAYVEYFVGYIFFR